MLLIDGGSDPRENFGRQCDAILLQVLTEHLDHLKLHHRCGWALQLIGGAWSLELVMVLDFIVGLKYRVAVAVGTWTGHHFLVTT